MERSAKSEWRSLIVPPGLVERELKPRSSGRTMVIDKGIGLRELQDLLDVGAHFIDYLKLAFGTSVLYSPEVLAEKISAIRSAGVDVYPGGTLFELACAQGKAEEFLARAGDIGFTCVEVSEGTFDVSMTERRRLVEQGKRAGLKVITEVGKKEKGLPVHAAAVAEQVGRDLADGADIVIVEGRDSGRGVGVYEEDGSPKRELIEEIMRITAQPERVMWEAPQASQQQYWLNRLGPNANLGNVQTRDVIALEATRMGLRGDTLKFYADELRSKSIGG